MRNFQRRNRASKRKNKKYLAGLRLEKKLREQEKQEDLAQYRSSMIKVMHEALGSGMWSMEFDEKGAMTSVSWSQEFRRMIGYKDITDFPDRLESWSELLHPEDHDRVLRAFQDTVADYSGRTTYDVQYRLRVKSGEWRWYHAQGRLIRRKDGTPRSYIGMFVDITERVRKDEALRDALEQARAASEAKTTFLSHMSHDIRTPINGIMGMTEIALRHQEDPEMVKDCLNKIDSSSRHLLSLVNDVLDLSRVEAGKTNINHEPFDLRALIDNCRSIIQGQLAGRNVDFVVNEENVTHYRFVGDELHIRQIFINILGNSVKFTKKGRISMGVRELEYKDGVSRMQFEFADTGIGMSQEFLPRLFDAFAQEEDDSRTTYKGTGLGMAITKDFTEMLGGTVKVRSKPGEGTCFTVELPLQVDIAAMDEQAESGAHEPAAVDLSGMTILVAEDNEINMEIAVMFLEEAGARVLQAWNGLEAVDMFRASAPGDISMILMDVMMPEMNGLEASREIRSLERPDAESIPIIAATANAFEEDVRKTREAGMNAHVSKPLDIDELLRTLSYFGKPGKTPGNP